MRGDVCEFDSVIFLNLASIGDFIPFKCVRGDVSVRSEG